MLKIVLPRPTTSAVSRGARWAAFDDEAQGPSFRPLTRPEAQALSQRLATVSPWQVVGAQAVIGALIALGAWALSGDRSVALSALYGAFTVVLPGALMARSVTGRLATRTPLVSAVSVLTGGFVKMFVSVIMLVIASRVVEHLYWPALLAALVLCMQTYWFALLWRGRS